MKIVLWIVGILLSIVAAVYTLVFTPLGNGIVKPILESKINDETNIGLKLTTFSLSFSDLNIVVALDEKNSLVIKGKYEIFKQSFDIDYNVQLKDMATLKALTKEQLNGSFFTDGNVAGDMAFIKVVGKSNFAKSQTSYALELTEFNPTSIIAKVKDADLATLLYMGNQKAYATAKIDLDLNFKNIKLHELDGNILFQTKKAKLNAGLMKKDFDLNVPKTSFTMDLVADLMDDDIVYKYKLNSNIAKISSAGRVTPEPLNVDIKYGVDVQELALLKPMTGADVRGNLKLNGKLKGDKKKMLLDGKTDFASSDTTFSVVLDEFAPRSIHAKVKSLKLQKALYMVKQPHYADALFDLNVDISDAREGSLKGTVQTKISKGLVDSKYMTKAYEFKSMMPRTIFSATTFTTLDKNIANTKLAFKSNLANLDVQNAKFNISDSSVDSDYTTKVHNLDKLFFVTQRHLKGSIKAEGRLKKAKDLDFTIHSKVASGTLNAKLHNDDFTATLTKMQSLEVLDMLLYPKVFKSNVDGDVIYNLATSKGTFEGKLYNGLFTNNKVLDLTKKYAHIDLYKQKFKGDINADINKENILAVVDLKSNTSSIVTKNTKLNTKANTIKSKIDVNANGNPIEFYLDGALDNPKVKVKADALIKKEATKAVKKGLNKYLKGLF
jgi:hypothetical protein